MYVTMGQTLAFPQLKRERISFLSRLVGKRVLLITRSTLEKLLAYFEEQTKMDSKDPKKVYAVSRSKKANGQEKEAAGKFA